MTLADYAGGLRARFDRLALRPPAAAADEAEQAACHPAAWAGLLAWCWQGAGPGSSAWHRPGAPPSVGRRLAIAALGAPADASTIAWADALARQLDGSARLAAQTGATAGLRLRLGVKTREAMWWRKRAPVDPWDAGWALVTPAAQRRWTTGFMPRRATLILAEGREAEDLGGVLAALVARSSDFRHPVRWLWVGGNSDLAPTQGLLLARFALG